MRLQLIFVSLFGFGYSLYAFYCNNIGEFYRTGSGESNYMESLKCGSKGLDYWDAKEKGINTLFGTLAIDGIVLGAYQFFGKSKKQREPVEKVSDGKKS